MLRPTTKLPEALRPTRPCKLSRRKDEEKATEPGDEPEPILERGKSWFVFGLFCLGVRFRVRSLLRKGLRLRLRDEASWKVVVLKKGSGFLLAGGGRCLGLGPL